MKLILTKHAKQRMSERGISIKEVEQVLEFPDYTIKKNNKIESYKKVQAREIKVVHRAEGKFIKIVTVITR